MRDAKTMLAVHFLGHGGISLDEMPIPEPKDQLVLVRVKAAAICGTDRENLVGEGQSRVPGHESAGQVAAVDKPARVKVGDRVGINCHITCGRCEHCLRGDLYFCPELRIVGMDIDGGFAEYALVPESCCMVLPDDISFEAGSLLMDVVGTAFRGIKRGDPQPGEKVAIWGAGPIGLSALLCARWFGAEVASVDLNEYRLGMAKDLGADRVLNPGKVDVNEVLMKWTEGRGLDIAYECSGYEAAIHQGLSALKKRGKLGIIGVSHSLRLNPWEQLICQETTIYGSRNFTLPMFDEMIAMVRQGVPIDKIVTHRFPLEEAEKAFEVFRSPECGKIVFTS
jgi:threonine dehydrogenase-like Zn-dependent dehydrogenase